MPCDGQTFASPDRITIASLGYQCDCMTDDGNVTFVIGMSDRGEDFRAITGTGALHDVIRKAGDITFDVTGRLWTGPKLISFYVMPSYDELSKVVEFFKTRQNLDINDYTLCVQTNYERKSYVLVGDVRSVIKLGLKSSMKLDGADVSRINAMSNKVPAPKKDVADNGMDKHDIWRHYEVVGEMTINDISKMVVECIKKIKGIDR